MTEILKNSSLMSRRFILKKILVCLKYLLLLSQNINNFALIFCSSIKQTLEHIYLAIKLLLIS